ncbi:MAG TPA: radical SAM protein [Clostridia bacterium]|jgi:wyosine [tRNA(Phe)-imidazoG37] synthetase (radical SAM superfamily)|nr:radical SAM protein [Clostridia bacterium]
MQSLKYVFGPIPSRRLGLSLGISPLPRKTCNYACIYCQLGRTRHMINQREEFVPLQTIISEFKNFLSSKTPFDVVTIVGEGEPTLYLEIEELIKALKKHTNKPVAVITNGSLLVDREIKKALKLADLVLPSLDAYDETSFRQINRPFGKIKFKEVYEGLVSFSREYHGQLWLEVMLIEGLYDEGALLKLKELLKEINYHKLYLNTPVRPPAENWVKEPSREFLNTAAHVLGGVVLDSLSEGSFYSEIEDDYAAVLSIIKRHPMNQHELNSFLRGRNCNSPTEILDKLAHNKDVEVVAYKGYSIYRLT